MGNLRTFAEVAARRAKWIALPAFFVAMLGLGGVGYCDHEARFAPAVPDPAHGYTNGVDFKGTTRYVTIVDARICAISLPISFSGMGIFVFIVNFYYLMFRRLPGR